MQDRRGVFERRPAEVAVDASECIGAQTGDRGGHDDRALALLDHDRCRVLDGEKGPDQVDAQDFLPEFDRLLEKLNEIRKALEDDTVFNVVGEILPAAQMERILRDYYAGNLGEADLEDRLLRDVSEDRFRAICQNALEGLASKKLNLQMLVERRARLRRRGNRARRRDLLDFPSCKICRQRVQRSAGLERTCRQVGFDLEVGFPTRARQ